MVTVLLSRWQHCFNPLTMLPVKVSFETGLIGHISSHVFRSAKFPKEISYEAFLFFENVLNFMQILKMQEKIEKNYCIFQIIA